jgi:tyrosyl-tRNA synthetase
MDIMGRDAKDADKDLSKLFYPAMQVSDIFYLDVDVAYGGMDQRRAHMLARELSKKLGRKKPVAVHTPLLTSLQAGGRMDQVKMSKSDPDSMLSIHDDEESVERKLMKAFCPEKMIEGNPVLEICKYVIFPELANKSFQIERPKKYGGYLEFTSYEELEKAFLKGLHPLDLKKTTAKYVNEMLKPIRAYFEKHPNNLDKMKEAGILK